MQSPIPVAPRDIIYVKVDKAFQDEIVTKSGFKLYKSTYFNPEWNVSVRALVVSSPITLSKRGYLKEFSNEVQAGDEIIMSYSVIADTEIRDRDTPVHKNLVFINGEYYWKCEYFAYLGKVVSGKLVAAQGYIFLHPPVEEKVEKVGLIWVPESAQTNVTPKKEKQETAVVMSVGRAKEGKDDFEPGVEVGDTVHFDPRYAQKYDVEGIGKVWILQHRYLYAKEVI